MKFLCKILYEIDNIEKLVLFLPSKRRRKMTSHECDISTSFSGLMRPHLGCLIDYFVAKINPYYDVILLLGRRLISTLRVYTLVQILLLKFFKYFFYIEVHYTIIYFYYFYGQKLMFCL